MKLSTATLLALLQQAEYDPVLWSEWLAADRTPAAWQHVAKAQPEKWTAKLRALSLSSKVLSPVLGPERAITTSLGLLSPAETLVREVTMQLASQKLCRAQANGLKVIAIAGSYGKTSVKHGLFHTLSQKASTLMTPASVNTPLGIAQVIRHQLRNNHQFLIVECGEYLLGDLEELLLLLRPDIGVLTPVGFAHQNRQDSGSTVADIFTEFLESQYRPATMLIDAKNRALFGEAKNVRWYGDTESDTWLTAVKVSLAGTRATVNSQDAEKLKLQTPLLGQHQVENLLPAIMLAEELTPLSRAEVVACLAYHPPITRRLQVLRNSNGSVVIDNSYNTNPGAWQELRVVLNELKLDPLTFITAGFVELNEATSLQEQEKLAKDVVATATTIGLIRTRTNAAFIEQLQAEFGDNCVVGWSLDEVLALLAERFLTQKYVWIEGGARELYQ